MKKHAKRKDKVTETRSKGIERVKDIAQRAEHDLQAAQQKWACSYSAAAYIVGLEKQVCFIQDACADLYHLVSPDSTFARLIKLRASRNEEELSHADGHRHRRS
jgi:hypothetical protein